MNKNKNSSSNSVIDDAKKSSLRPFRNVKKDEVKEEKRPKLVYDYSLPTSSTRKQGKYTSFLLGGSSQNGNSANEATTEKKYTGTKKYTEALIGESAYANKPKKSTEIKLKPRVVPTDKKHIKPEPTEKIKSDYSAYGKDYLELLQYNEDYQNKIGGHLEVRKADYQVAENEYLKAAEIFDEAQNKCADIISENNGTIDENGILRFNTNAATNEYNRAAQAMIDARRNMIRASDRLQYQEGLYDKAETKYTDFVAKASAVDMDQKKADYFASLGITEEQAVRYSEYEKNYQAGTYDLKFSMQALTESEASLKNVNEAITIAELQTGNNGDMTLSEQFRRMTEAEQEQWIKDTLAKNLLPKERPAFLPNDFSWPPITPKEFQKYLDLELEHQNKKIDNLYKNRNILENRIEENQFYINRLLNDAENSSAVVDAGKAAYEKAVKAFETAVKNDKAYNTAIALSDDDYSHAEAIENSIRLKHPLALDIGLLNEDEKKVFYFLVGEGNSDFAISFASTIVAQRREDNQIEFFSKPVLRELYAFTHGLENAITSPIKWIDPNFDSHLLTDKSVYQNVASNATGLGRITMMASESLGQMAPAIIGHAVSPLAGMATTFISSGGNAVSEGVAKGMSYKEALIYGSLSGISEATLNKALGGVTALGNSASNKAISSFVSKIKNPLFRTAVKLGGNLLSEITEENLQNYLTPAFEVIAKSGLDFFISANHDRIDIPGWTEFTDTTLTTILTTLLLETGTLPKIYSSYKFETDTLKPWTETVMKHMPKNSEVYSLAKEFAEMINNGEVISPEFFLSRIQEADLVTSIDIDLSPKEDTTMPQGETEQRAAQVQEANPEATVLTSESTQSYLDAGIDLKTAQQAGEVLDGIVRGEITAENITNNQMDRLNLMQPNMVKVAAEKLGIEITRAESKSTARNTAKRAIAQYAKQKDSTVSSGEVVSMQQQTPVTFEGETEVAPQAISESPAMAQEQAVAAPEIPSDAMPTKATQTEAPSGSSFIAEYIAQNPKATDAEIAQAYEAYRNGQSIPAVNRGVNSFTASEEMNEADYDDADLNDSNIERADAVDYESFESDYLKYHPNAGMADVAVAYQRYLNGEEIVDTKQSTSDAMPYKQFRKQYLKEHKKASSDEIEYAYNEYLNEPSDTKKHSAKQYGVERNEYSEQVNEQVVENVDALAKLFKLNIRFADLSESNDNGYYDPDTGEIVLDIHPHAAFAFVAGHEITHHMKDHISEAAWKNFERYAIKAMGGKKAVADKQASHEKYAKEDVAREEVACDFVGKLLSDKAMLNDFCEAIKNQELNKEAAKGVINAVKRFFGRITNMTKKGDTATAELIDKVKKAYDTDIKTATNAIKALQTAFNEATKSDALLKNKNTTNDGGVKRLIRENFGNEINAWDGKSKRVFKVGKTSDTLKKIGIKDSEIIWHGGKIAEIMRKHPAMTRETIKQVPEILEAPVIILASKNSDSRIVMFGTITDKNGMPVTAILELQPTTKGGQVIDVNVIASAYGKEGNLKNFIESSGLVYLDSDRKRTKRWMQSVGLQLPSDATAFGSIGSITYPNGKVKIESVPYNQYMQNNTKNSVNPSEAKNIKRDIKITTDNNGKALSTEQQEYFKESAIRDENGKLKVVYHGTDAEFTVFDFLKSGTNVGRAEGYGFNFTDNSEVAKHYGKSKQYYLNITKPLQGKHKTMTSEQFRSVVSALVEHDLVEYADEGLTWKDSFLSNYVDTYRTTKASAIREVANIMFDANDTDVELVYELANADGRNYSPKDIQPLYDVLRESTGYDGIHTTWKDNNGGESSEIYIAFKPEQIKLTSNKKPTHNPDIRYAKKTMSDAEFFATEEGKKVYAENYGTELETEAQIERAAARDEARAEEARQKMHAEETAKEADKLLKDKMKEEADNKLEERRRKAFTPPKKSAKDDFTEMSREDLAEKLAYTEKSLKLERLRKEHAQEQLKLTGGNKVDPSGVTTFVKNTIKDYDEGGISRERISGFTNDLVATFDKAAEIYDKLKDAEASATLLWEHAQKMVGEIVQESRVFGSDGVLYKGYSELRKELKDTTFLLPRQFAKDISPEFGKWKNRYFGKFNVKLVESGEGNIDVVYQELSNAYPGLFRDSLASEPDLLIQIANVADKISSKPEANIPL